MSTVVHGDIELATYTGPDNAYHANATLEGFQLRGTIYRGKTASNEVDNLQIRDVEIWGGSIDLRGPTVYRPTFERVACHSWTGTTIIGNLRMARFIGCKWLSEDVDVNAFPLIELTGEQCAARFESNWIQPRGMGIKAIGGGVSITLENNHIEPLRPKSEAAQQSTVLPRMEIGTGTVVADRLDAMDVQPIILRGTTLRCPDRRAIDQWGGAIPLEQGFVGQAA